MHVAILGNPMFDKEGRIILCEETATGFKAAQTMPISKANAWFILQGLAYLSMNPEIIEIVSKHNPKLSQ